jgi:hypothetical protein
MEREGGVAILFTDMVMPGLDGIALAAEAAGLSAWSASARASRVNGLRRITSPASGAVPPAPSST